MSIADSFLHPRPFPFNPNDHVPQVGYDYVALTETSGDGGLAEAQRLWWQLESVGFSVQWVTTLSGGPLLSYDQDIDWPENSGGGTFPTFDVMGSIVASAVEVAAQPAEAPKDRIPYEEPRCLHAYCETASAPILMNLHVLRVEGEWRLYYNFEFNALNDQWLLNPEFIGFGEPIVTTGTFSLFGYDLSYVLRATDGDDPNFALDSISVAATSEFFTYAP